MSNPTILDLSNEEFESYEVLLEARLCDIEAVIPLPNNPKLHADKYLTELITNLGFRHRPIINSRTSHILAGNGRIEKLRERKDADKPPVKGVAVTKDGRWCIPMDFTDVPEEDELTVAVAFNRSSEIGAWDHEKLAIAFAGTSQEMKGLLGWDDDLVDAIQAFYTPAKNDPDDWDSKVEEAVSSAPKLSMQTPLQEDHEDFDDEKWDDEVAKAADPVAQGNPSDDKPDLSVLRYIVRTETLKEFRKAVRHAKKEAELTDTSDAIDYILHVFMSVASL